MKYNFISGGFLEDRILSLEVSFESMRLLRLFDPAFAIQTRLATILLRVTQVPRRSKTTV